MNEVGFNQSPSKVVSQPPVGLECLYQLCKKLYPDQVNPLQVTAVVKYWLGGPDPLDYISMYSNPGSPENNIPPHWHYISFGLTDLHGDGRVHDTSTQNAVSGFGFELTFRLKKESGESTAPTWPATLMQSLAKYVFQSGNSLCAGDHVSWHCALDNSESRIQHMLMTSDKQLLSTQTPYGSVDFLQIVGICTEELKAAQKWNGMGILDMISQVPLAGGALFITDMRRGESLFDLDLNCYERVERGFDLDGSNLSGVSARCVWVDEHDSTTLSKTLEYKNFYQSLDASTMSGYFKTDKQNNNYVSNELISQQKKIESVHLIFNLEAGCLLSLAIRGRVKHGRHFTFKSIEGDTTITFVARSVVGTMVSVEDPYVALGSWLQVLITEDIIQEMADTFQVLASPETPLPKTFFWPEKRLKVTVVAEKI